MKLLISIWFCLFTLCCCQNKYANRLDRLDIDYALSTGRILDNYLKCIIDRGPCTVEGRELKNAIPEALNGCSGCNEPTKKIVKKASIYIMENRPALWNSIRTHFDPEGKYMETFYKFLESD